MARLGRSRLREVTRSASARLLPRASCDNLRVEPRGKVQLHVEGAAGRGLGGWVAGRSRRWQRAVRSVKAHAECGAFHVSPRYRSVLDGVQSLLTSKRVVCVPAWLRSGLALKAIIDVLNIFDRSCWHWLHQGARSVSEVDAIIDTE